MRRRARTAFVFLLLGAIANVVIAEVFAAWPVMTESAGRWSYEVPEEDLDSRGWRLTINRSLARVRVVVESQSAQKGARPTLLDRYLPWWCDLSDVLAREQVDHRIYPWRLIEAEPEYPLALIDDATGWPLAAFRCRWKTRNFHRGRWVSAELTGGLSLTRNRPPARRPHFARALPYQPIWRGIVANSVVLGGILWALMCTGLLLRRVIRLQRGRCPVCKYPIGSSDVCTECGAAIPESYRSAPNGG